MPAIAPRPYRPPAPVPIVKPLSALGLMLALRKNAIATFGIWDFTLPVTSGKTILGHLTTVGAPAGVKHVLVDNVANYVKDALQLRVLRPGLGDGLLTAEGEAWKRTRRTLAPLFSPRAVEGFTAAMDGKARAMVARLVSLADGSRIDAGAEMARVTVEILTVTLFSDAISTSQEKFAAAFTAFFESQGRLEPLDILNAPSWIPRFNSFTTRPAIEFFNAQVKEMIARRRALVAEGKAPRDLMTLLLEAADPETGQGLSEAEVGANIVTFMGAGHETTANTLSWAIFLLSKHPAVREAAEAEADGADAFALDEWPERLPLLRAVIEEAMRLYPPAATLTRAAVEEDEVLGRKVPKGSMVVISPYVLHRHQLLWDEPDLFRPERFMPGAREKIDRYAYIPFGAGPRICIGLRFAMFEAVIVLARLLQRLRLAMAPGEGVFPVQRVTLRPSPRLEMLLTRR